MITTDTPERPKLRPSQHDGLAIVSFIFMFFFPVLGFILGWVSITSAHLDGRRASGLAIAATILSPIFILIIIIVAVSIAHSMQPACDLNNPAWPNC